MMVHKFINIEHGKCVKRVSMFPLRQHPEVISINRNQMCSTNKSVKVDYTQNSSVVTATYTVHICTIFNPFSMFFSSACHPRFTPQSLRAFQIFPKISIILFRPSNLVELPTDRIRKPAQQVPHSRVEPYSLSLDPR